MKVIVVGAAGKTGELVVERAVDAGHDVTAFVHHAETYKAPPGVRVLTGDAGDLTAVSQALAGQEAVVDAIGGKTPFLSTDLERKTARTILEAMQQNKVGRLIAISMLGVGDSVEQADFFYEHLLLPTFLRGARQDKEAMETAIKQSSIVFVIVRPSILKDDPATGSVQVLEGDQKAHHITRADLAQFLVDQLKNDTYLGQTVTVTNE